MNKNKLIKVALLSLTAISLASLSTTAFSAKAAKKVKMEKCSGIVRSGKADGQEMIKGKKVDWILVPAGACEKLVDGVVLYDK